MKKYYNKYCKCGCGQKIEIKPSHKYHGIPDYICGHHLKGLKRSKETKERMRMANLQEKNPSFRHDITKDFLIREYSENEKTGLEVARMKGCSWGAIKRRLEKFGISIRTKKEMHQGKHNGGYIDGRCSKVYYCKELECSNEITYHCWKCGNGRCLFCEMKRRLIVGIINNSGKNNGRYNLERHRKHYCIEPNCNNEICYENWKKGSGRCIPCSKSGRRNHHFGLPSFHIKRVSYKGISMRSSWETLFAKYLDSKRIKWLYESKRFDLGSSTYCPDFYLPKTKEYIEIKGWWREKGRRKFELFKDIYPNEKITILMKNDLIKLKILKRKGAKNDE